MLEEERRGERGTHFPLDGRGLQPTKFGWEEEEESASAGCRLEKKINWEAAAEGGGRCFLIQTLSHLKSRTFLKNLACILDCQYSPLKSNSFSMIRNPQIMFFNQYQNLKLVRMKVRRELVR